MKKLVDARYVPLGILRTDDEEDDYLCFNFVSIFNSDLFFICGRNKYVTFNFQKIFLSHLKQEYKTTFCYSSLAPG